MDDLLPSFDGSGELSSASSSEFLGFERNGRSLEKRSLKLVIKKLVFALNRCLLI